MVPLVPIEEEVGVALIPPQACIIGSSCGRFWFFSDGNVQVQVKVQEEEDSGTLLLIVLHVDIDLDVAVGVAVAKRHDDGHDDGDSGDGEEK